MRFKTVTTYFKTCCYSIVVSTSSQLARLSHNTRYTEVTVILSVCAKTVVIRFP